MNAAVPPDTVAVLPAHRFDKAALARWLAGRLEDAASGFVLRQFQGGQSNPTFLLVTGSGHRYVLRKKPPGTLLASAHQVEREYRVMAALASSQVAVPAMRLLCEDASVIGTAFYVMDFVPGRVIGAPELDAARPGERRTIYRALVDTLAALHRVDHVAAGLSGFGRPGGYVARQVARWSRQYEASRAGTDIPAMDYLRDWLGERAGIADETAIVHGDYRVGNVILAEDTPRIAAVLDWELSTIGHPLADLAYFCLPWHLPHGVAGVKGLAGADLDALGLPQEAEILERYAERTGRPGIADWPLFLAFSLSRLAAILQGVHARAVQGNASNSDALEVGRRAGLLAEAGQRIAREAG